MKTYKLSILNECSYLIYKSESLYYAKNGTTGIVDYVSRDAATVIQNAINSLNPTGGRIYLKAGTYNIYSMLTIHSPTPIIIEGENRDATFFYFAAIANGIIIGDASNVTQGCVIKNIRIDGGGINTTDLITFRNTVFSTVENVHLTNFNIGILFDTYGGLKKSYHAMIKDCQLQGTYGGGLPMAGKGVKLTGSIEWTANMNTLLNCQIGMCDIGIDLDYSYTTKVIGCDCSYCNTGIKIERNGGSHRLMYNAFEGNNIWDIQIATGSPDNLIMENTFAQIPGAISDAGIETTYWHNLNYKTENKGVLIANGTGTKTIFTISHNLAVIPINIQLEAKSADAAGNKYWNADATNITITFVYPPPAGINNVIISWKAEL